jgi:putative hemin transport protein
VTEQGNVVIVGGDQIDLQCHLEHWQHGFAVAESGEKGVQRSLQFYDTAGVAVHKVFLRAQSDIAAYLALVEQFSDENQLPGIVARPSVTTAVVQDFPSFLMACDSVHDARDLYALLAQCEGACLFYLQQLAAETARQVPVPAARVLLEAAANEAFAPLILTGNAGVTQAHSGPVDKIVVMGPWLNVLDPGFNLHLREDYIASAWVVVQSGLHGMFSALVLLDGTGSLIALFASANVAGESENAWAELIDRLPKV